MMLADYQFSFNGVTAGPGTPYRILSIDGLRTMPNLVSSDQPRLRRSGVFANGDSLSSRLLTISLMVSGTSVADFETNLTALETALVPVRPGQFAAPFLFKQPGQNQRRFVAARPRKNASPQMPTYGRLWHKMNLQLVCPDPAQLDDVLTTTVIGSTGTIVNVGNLESYPVITLTPSGGAVGIVNKANNCVLVLTGAIPSPCIVDTGSMTVVDGAGANRFDVVHLSAGMFPFLSP